jgi:hypothetical protein
MVSSATRAPSAVMATAAWVCLWVSTPTMMSAGGPSLILPVLQSDRGPSGPAGGQDCDGMNGLRLL